MAIQKLFLTAVFILCSLWATSQVVNNSSELNDAINAAQPGSTISLAAGNWNNVFIDIDKNGTDTDPITITSENPGATIMTGNSRVYMEGSYLILSGLIFQDPENLVVSSGDIEPVIELKRCDYCKILNNKIDNYNGTEAQKSMKFKWVLVDGQYNEIAYNSFIGKYGVGSIINDNRNSTEPDYLKIHHNYFADRTPINELNEDNDQDAIRIGNSSTSLDDSFSEVYENYFYNFFGEVEVISNKSGHNKYYNNTFRNYAGTLTLRHGDNCEVYNNYFFADNNTFSGGIRVIGESHKIYNNYIEGVNSKKADGSTSNATGGINVSNGRLNSALNGYYQVKNAQVINNTFVNCDYALRVGTTVSSDLDQEPQNLVVANNITYNTSTNDYQIATPPTGASVSEGNLIDLPLDDMKDDGNFYRLSAGSTPIDAGLGAYAFLDKDILNGDRDNDFDAGAEEFGSGGTRLPYTEFDVGTNIGFGATSGPSLFLSPTTIVFGKYTDTISFQIVSNVDWTITNDVTWVDLDISSGSGTTTIMAAVLENTTGLQRTGTIAINEINGGSNLAAELTIEQLNTFIPEEIPIIATTSLGMQDKDDISEENAYNDDLTNYWTGDPDTEEEVSITFDLSCRHVLTDIGIHFWKADERSTTFSLAISNDSLGPFRTIIDAATSADANVTVNTEQFFNLDGVIARYVKFIGIGNSSSSNWTSIANVNIYGDLNCETGVAVFDNQLLDQTISIHPNPVSEGLLSIYSSDEALGQLEIYNTAGELVLLVTDENSNTKTISIDGLRNGVYFIKSGNAFYGKFIKK